MDFEIELEDMPNDASTVAEFERSS